MSAALKAASKLKPGQKCVVILPDTLRNYMTKFLDDQWLAERDIIKLEPDEKLWYGERTKDTTVRERSSMLRFTGGTTRRSRRWT